MWTRITVRRYSHFRELEVNAIDDNGSNYLMESWICPPEELGEVMAASGFPRQQ